MLYLKMLLIFAIFISSFLTAFSQGDMEDAQMDYYGIEDGEIVFDYSIISYNDTMKFYKSFPFIDGWFLFCEEPSLIEIKGKAIELNEIKYVLSIEIFSQKTGVGIPCPIKFKKTEKTHINKYLNMGKELSNVYAFQLDISSLAVGKYILKIIIKENAFEKRLKIHSEEEVFEKNIIQQEFNILEAETQIQQDECYGQILNSKLMNSDLNIDFCYKTIPQILDRGVLVDFLRAMYDFYLNDNKRKEAYSLLLLSIKYIGGKESAYQALHVYLNSSNGFKYFQNNVETIFKNSEDIGKILAIKVRPSLEEDFLKQIAFEIHTEEE